MLLKKAKWHMPTDEEKHFLNSLGINPPERECPRCEYMIQPRKLSSAWCPECQNKIGLSKLALKHLKDFGIDEFEENEENNMPLSETEQELVKDMGKDLEKIVSKQLDEKLKTKVPAEIKKSVSSWAGRFFILGVERFFPFLEGYLDNLNLEGGERGGQTTSFDDYVIDGSTREETQRILDQLPESIKTTRTSTTRKQPRSKRKEVSQTTQQIEEPTETIEKTKTEFPDEVKSILNFLYAIDINDLEYYIQGREKGINSLLFLAYPHLRKLTPAHKAVVQSFDFDEILGLLEQTRSDLYDLIMKKNKKGKPEGKIWLKILFKKIKENCK